MNEIYKITFLKKLNFDALDHPSIVQIIVIYGLLCFVRFGTKGKILFEFEEINEAHLLQCGGRQANAEDKCSKENILQNWNIPSRERFLGDLRKCKNNILQDRLYQRKRKIEIYQT